MTTQRVTGDEQLTTMSTKATAFTIDELLRPDLHVSATRRHDYTDLHQCNTPGEWSLRTGKHHVTNLHNVG